ncbi:MAG: DUF4957 domain-containing protein [Bacteroidales bacterium]|nr:DUF4957 domain-containing protein [Bacteroidales bacterium]
MKKLTLLIAALVLSFTAQATIVNCSPNTDAIDWWMTKGDTLVFADGEYIQTYSIDFNQAGVVFMAAEGAKPVIKNSSYFKIHATTTFIGITFDGQNTSNYALTTRGEATKDLILTDCEFKNFVQYNIEIKENTTLTTLNIENCVFDGTNTTPDAIYGKGIVSQTTIQGSEFKNYTEYCIYANDYYGARYDNLTINNCLFHDCAYSAVFLANAKDGLEKQSCSDFTLTNSTIYNVGAASTKGRGVVELRTNSNITSDQEVLIDHVTLYNFASSENAWSGGFYIGNSANTKISNCIAMNPEDKKTLYANPYHAYTGAEITNSLYFNCDYNAEHGATTTDLLKADPMFVDAANADFMLYAESPAVGMGDPRWGVKAGLQPGEGKLKAAVDAAEDGATIVLGDETYEVSTSIEFNKEGLTIVAAEGTKPVIKLVDAGGNSSLKLSATTTFDGITFDGNNITKYPVTSTGTNANQFTFVNCEFKNYTKWAITNEYGSSHVDNVIIDKCLFHDGGSAVYFNPTGYDGQHSCSYFKMTNTTIYNINYDDWGVGVIHVSANGDATGEQNEVEIDHITMYNVSTKEYGAITVRKSSKLSVTNSIIANPASNSDKYAFYIYGGNVTNTLYHNSKVNSDAPSMSTINADPLFVNAAENNFDLYANSPAVGAGTDGSTLGDPRWNVSDKTIGTGKRVNVTTADVESLPWIVQNAASNLQPGDTLVLADGQYTLSTIEFIKENVVVMAAEGATPEIISASEWANLEISANTTFDGITFNGNNVAQYLISIQDSTTMKTKLVLQNCELKNWLQWAISNQYSKNVVVDSLIIDNCLFHDGLGSAIRFSEKAPEGEHACNYFKMTNSTIYNVVSTEYAAVVELDANGKAEGDQNEVTIDHITLYNYDAADLGAIYVAKTSNLSITNSIIATPEDKGQRALYVYGGTVDNTIHFNGSKRSGNTVYTNCLTDDPLFVDAANNNFMLQANSPAIGKATDGSNLGDPRWGVEEPTLITLTTGDNSQVITDNIGKTVNVKIERSFTTNDGYYTLCVPFNMDPSVIGKAYSLGTITKHVTGEGINIELKEESELLAGVPYLVLPKANMSELVVENVTILSDIASGQNVYSKELNVNIFFEGFYSASGQTNGTTQYYVGNNGYLYNGEVEIRGLCGLFTITDKDGNPIKVRARVVTREEVETGLDNNQLPNINIQKVLENGQLIIIRDGVKYNVQGQKL